MPVGTAPETTLQLDRYAPDAKALVSSAQQLADERRHVEVEPLHLLARAVERSRGVAELFRRAGADPAQVMAQADAALRRLPANVAGVAYLSPALLDLLARAEREAARDRVDRVGVEHLMNALSQELRGGAGDLLAAVGLGPGAFRPHASALREADARAPTPAPREVDPARDLVAQARGGELDPVVGRDAELARLVQVLERRTKRHPLVVGEPGVGKTALLRGLALRVARGEVPPDLAGASVHLVDAPGLVAGARVRGEVEDRLRRIVERSTGASGDRVLAIDGVEALLTGAGATASDALRPWLDRDGVRLVVTTTPDGLRRLEDRDPALLRKLTPLTLDAPSVDETIAILRGIAPRLEAHHHATLEDGALAAAARLAKRYLAERALPDAAVDLLDEAAARRRVRGSAPPASAGDPAAPVRVGAGDVAATVGEWTGVPVDRVLEGEAERLLQMEARVGARVIGQDEAVRAVARAVRRSRVGLRDPRRPIGSFLFLGPSGVGKTELAKAVAEFLFDDEQALTRLDMSEFMERHMAARLVGAPPGYVDSEQGGFLTEAVRRRPYSVLLFDEVEKAHSDVFDLLLQVLEEGRLTDARGRVADFSDAVVVMTSNLGSQRILDADPGVLATPEGREALREVLVDDLRRFFRPEMLNRIDDIVVFRPLGKGDLRGIVDVQLRRVEAMLAPRELRLEVTAAARDRLVELGWEPGFGARPLRRAIVRHLQDPLAEALLAGEWPAGSTVLVDAAADGLALRRG